MLNNRGGGGEKGSINRVGFAVNLSNLYATFHSQHGVPKAAVVGNGERMQSLGGRRVGVKLDLGLYLETSS